MKKLTALLAIFAIAATFCLSGCTPSHENTSSDANTGNSSDTEQEQITSTPPEIPMTAITLNEVAHSIFYAPMYVAIEEGYFAEEGIDLTLETGYGADKTMPAVLSGDADIGFMGSEASNYAYLEGANDPVINFAQLTQRAGNFLVAREPITDFKWTDLKGTNVLGGRKGASHQSM